MPTWLRSVIGIAAGGANLFANGMNWKQVLVSLGIAGLGVVSHLTSQSGKPAGLSSGSHYPPIQHHPDAVKKQWP